MLTFEKIFIEFHRELYFWDRFEKRVFPTDSLSRTDTFGTHCIHFPYVNCFIILLLLFVSRRLDERQFGVLLLD
jgi:hypothetical protein